VSEGSAGCKHWVQWSVKWPEGLQRLENWVLARRAGAPEDRSLSMGFSKGRWETLQDTSRSPGGFSLFPKDVSVVPRIGNGTDRSEFGMGPGKGYWGLQELLTGWLVMLGDIAAGCRDETAGGACLQLAGEQAGIWGLPNHLRPLQRCLSLKEFPCTCCHPRVGWEMQHRASWCGWATAKSPLALRRGGCSRSRSSHFQVKYIHF